MKRQTWIVSRCEPWPSGEQCIEIATDVDHLDPGLFWEDKGSRFDELCKEYDDPRDAVRAAIEARDLWVQESGELVKIDHANPVFYGMEGKTDDELRAWADKEWDNIPACDWCGGRNNTHTGQDGASTYLDEYGDPIGFFCCLHHLDMYVVSEDEAIA